MDNHIENSPGDCVRRAAPLRPDLDKGMTEKLLAEVIVALKPYDLAINRAATCIDISCVVARM
jgi:hypothetical protein